MPRKDLAIVALLSAALPWVAMQLIVAMGVYGPLFWGILGPDTSEVGKVSVRYSQWLFDALVVAVPVTVALAWATRSKPLLLAAALVIGYSISWFVWGIAGSSSVSDILSSYVFPNHLLLIFMLGFGALIFRKLFSGNRNGRAAA